MPNALTDWLDQQMTIEFIDDDDRGSYATCLIEFMVLNAKSIADLLRAARALRRRQTIRDRVRNWYHQRPSRLMRSVATPERVTWEIGQIMRRWVARRDPVEGQRRAVNWARHMRREAEKYAATISERLGVGPL